MYLPLARVNSSLLRSLHVDPREPSVSLPNAAAAAPDSNGPTPRAIWPRRFNGLRGDLTTWFLPYVVAPYVLTRLAILVVGEVASISIDHLSERGPVAPAYSTSWFEPLLRFDAQWYLNIAANWYQYDPTVDGGQTAVVFFPLYPFLIRVSSAISGSSTAETMALVIANVFAVLGLALLYRLTRREFGAPVAQRTVWYMLAFPVSFYLSSAYAEPVFLAACVGAIYAARTQHWYLASLAGVAATLSRPYGVLIVAPLVLEFLRQNWANRRAWLDARAASLLLPVIGLAAWMGYLYTLSGDPLVFVHAQAAWNQQHVTSPLQTLLIAYGRTRDQQLSGRFDLGGLQFAIASIGVVATLVAWRVLPATYAMYATVFCAVLLVSGSTMSIWRHVYLVFPLFMVAGRAGASTIFDRAYVSLSLIAAGLFTTLLVTSWTIVS
jgi:hypothetical protein